MNRSLAHVAWCACVLALGCPGPGASQPGPTTPPDPTGAPSVAFVHVDVLPMTGAGEERLRDQTVVVRGDRIVAVGAAAEVDVPPGVEVIDASGKTLVPGLADMHVHLPPLVDEHRDTVRRVLVTMIANGVTTARGLAGHPSHIELRRQVDEGELLGPSLYVAAPALHQGNTPTVEAARKAVKDAKQAGFDLIKSHAIADPVVWAAVQDEAKQQGIAVAGHVTNEVGLARALEAGQQIEHLDGFVAALLPEGSPVLAQPWGQFPPPEVLQAVDADRIDALAKRVAAAGVYDTPTLALFERIVQREPGVEALRSDPAMRFVSPPALDQWTAQKAEMDASGTFDGIAEPFVALRRQLVAALSRAGAPIMAGSDSPQVFLMTGFALHDELEALARAGLSPGEALAAATAVPARYLASLPGQGSATGRAADFGSIAEGARADLVLLAGSPLEDVRLTRCIDGVMLRGEWLDRGELDALLREVIQGEADAPGPLVPRPDACPG
jgi:cytosine/adenosine deaminase-related metal-dependent hydrolase